MAYKSPHTQVEQGKLTSKYQYENKFYVMNFVVSAVKSQRNLERVYISNIDPILVMFSFVFCLFVLNKRAGVVSKCRLKNRIMTRSYAIRRMK